MTAAIQTSTESRFRAATTKLRRGAKVGATAATITLASLFPANAQQKQAQVLVAPPVVVTPNVAEPRAPGSLFTEKECRQITGILLAEMEAWKPIKGDPQSVMTSTLPTTALDFTGVRNKKFTCVGKINWATLGEKAILDAVFIGLDLLERDGSLPKGIAERFARVYPEKPVPLAGMRTPAVTPR